MFENLFGQWDEDFMDLQEPENEELAVTVPQKQPMQVWQIFFLCLISKMEDVMNQYKMIKRMRHA